MKLVSTSQIGGMGGLRWEDQQKIQAKIDGGGGGGATTRYLFLCVFFKLFVLKVNIKIDHALY